MSVEFTDPAGAQYIDFGSTSAIIGSVQKTISVWAYLDDISTNHGIFKIDDGTSGGAANDFVDFYTVAGKLRFYANFSTTNGLWTTTSDVLSTGSWLHLAVTFNGSATTNNPSFYVNGVSKTVTENATPVGTYQTGTSSTLYIGTDNAALAPDGKYADVRAYSIAYSSVQLTSLYNAGVFSPNLDTSLAFHAPLNNCTALSGSAYDGYTLTSSQIFYDRIGCVQGTPSGSPLGSATNPS